MGLVRSSYNYNIASRNTPETDTSRQKTEIPQDAIIVSSLMARGGEKKKFEIHLPTTLTAGYKLYRYLSLFLL